MRIKPVPLEALSSWVGRNACLYDLSLDELWRQLFGYSASSQSIDQIDDISVIKCLAQLGSLDVDKVFAMTFAGVCPFSFGKSAGVYYDYVVANRVMLSSWNEWRGKRTVGGEWGAWVSRPTERACPQCIIEDGVYAAKLHWRLPISLTCARHGCWLFECKTFPGQRVIWKEDIKDLRCGVSEELIYFDSHTEEAMSTGWIKDLGGISARSWFRTVRIVIEELTVPKSRLNKIDRDVVQEVKYRSRQDPIIQPQFAFEEIPWLHQRTQLTVAALYIIDEGATGWSTLRPNLSARSSKKNTC